MYIVRWCDHEGNLKERICKNLPAAKAEAQYLNHTHGGVEIITPDGKRIWPKERSCGPASEAK